MKRTVWLVLGLIFVCSLIASASDWLELRYNPAEGDESNYTFTLDMDVGILAMNQQQPPMKFHVEAAIDQKIVEVKDDGTFVQQTEIKATKVLVNNKEQQIPAQQANNANNKVLITLDQFGDVKKYEIAGQSGDDQTKLEGLLKQIPGDNTMLTDFIGELLKQVDKIIATDMPELPKEPVQVGYKWYSYYKSEAGDPLVLSLVTEYSLLQADVKGGQCTIQSLSKADFSLKVPIPLPDGTSTEVTATGTTQMGAWTQRDLETGGIIDMKSLPGMPLKVQMKVAGQVPAGDSGTMVPLNIQVDVSGKLNMKKQSDDETNPDLRPAAAAAVQ